MCPCTSEAFTGQRLKWLGMRKAPPPWIPHLLNPSSSDKYEVCGNISSGQTHLFCGLHSSPKATSTARHSPEDVLGTNMVMHLDKQSLQHPVLGWKKMFKTLGSSPLDSSARGATRSWQVYSGSTYLMSVWSVRMTQKSDGRIHSLEPLFYIFRLDNNFCWDQ